MTNKIDVKVLDTAALKQALQVLEKASPDYLVIDLMTQIKDELKVREVSNDKS